MVFRTVEPIEELRVLFFKLFEVFKVKVDAPFLIEPVVHIGRIIATEFVSLSPDLKLSQSHLVSKLCLLNFRQSLAGLE